MWYTSYSDDEKEVIMKIKGAMTILTKEAKFLGMTVGEVMDFIDSKPMAFSPKTRQAYEVYKKEQV